MSKTYPRTMLPQWRERESWGRGVEIRCWKCLHVCQKGERVMVQETQVDWFRGNDVVQLLCEACAKADGHTPPPTKAERRKLAEVQEAAGLIKKIRWLESELVKKRKRLAELEGAA